MKRYIAGYIALILTAFLITGCANSPFKDIETTLSKVVSGDTVDTIQLAYGSALAIAVSYRRTCEQKLINKSCWTIIAKLQPYEAKAYQSVISLRNFVRNNPQANAYSYIQLAKENISIFTSQQTLNGVN